MFAKISRIFLFASLFAPLVVIRNSYFPFIAEKAVVFRILVELALLFFVAHALLEKDALQNLKTKLRHPLVIAAGAFAAIFLLSAFFGVNPTQSVWSNFERGDGAFQLIHYVLFFALTVVLFPDKKSIDRLLQANLVVSVLMCFYAIGQLFADPSNSGFILAAGNRVSGTLGNPSYLAAYILINLVIILYFFLQRREAWWRTIFAALFVFEGYILLSTGTRGAFLALIAGLVTVCVINLFITGSGRVKLWLVVALAVTFGLPALFFSTHDAPIWRNVPVLNRLINYQSAVSDIRPRIWTWNTAIQGVKDRPLLGYGAENFPYPFDKYYNPGHYGIESFFDRAHNIFLEYLITGGILLLLAWLALFYFYYKSLFARTKNFWWSILFVVPIMYVCQGFFLFDTLPIYVIFFLFLALFICQEEDRKPTKAAPNKKTEIRVGPLQMSGILILLAATAGGIYYGGYLPMRKNHLLTRALVLQNTFTGELQQQAKNLTVTPGAIITAYENALNFNSPVGQEETIGMFQKFTIYIIEILSRNPEAVKNPQYIGEVRNLVNEVNGWFDNNLRLFPGIKEAYLNGGINLRAGLAFDQPDLLARGKKQYYDLLTTAPDRLEIINVLIEVARLEKDQATLDTMIAKAKALRPDLQWK